MRRKQSDAQKLRHLRWEIEQLRKNHERLLQQFANNEYLFEFHIKQLAEANMQLQRQVAKGEEDLLDAMLRLNLEGN